MPDMCINVSYADWVARHLSEAYRASCDQDQNYHTNSLLGSSKQVITVKKCASEIILKHAITDLSNVLFDMECVWTD